MSDWIRDLSLRYKFWAVNAVVFFITLLLVLFAMHLEQDARQQQARQAAEQQAVLLAAWPSGKRHLVGHGSAGRKVKHHHA